MKKQQRFVLLILCAHLIEVHRLVAAHSPKIGPKKQIPLSRNTFSKCPHVRNDEDVVTSPQFIIPLNPAVDYSKSHGRMNERGHIIHLKIINENFIPPTLLALKQLKRLEIRNTCFSPCHRSRLPSTIQCLASSLTELAIYDMNITHLPLHIGNLVRLQVLKLSNTGLMSLPDTIGYLSLLTMLYLPDNNLETLPSTIQNLRSLRQLTLTNNPRLHSLHPLDNLPSLIVLDTRHCSITALPQHLPQLTILDMSNNSLTQLNGINTLGEGTNNTKFFYLDHNCIASLSPDIGLVTNLSVLKLNANKLGSLPREFFNISTLTHLDIEHNQFDLHHLETIVSHYRAANPNAEIFHKNQTKLLCRRI